MNIFGFLAYILGPLMELLYRFIPSYALAIIVFTLLIKLVSFPLAVKQQKSMAKTSVFSPMMNEIQQKYKNNKEKQQQELMALQQEYGFSPTAGCLPMLVNMLVLFGMYQVVYQPLRYILGVSNDSINAACATAYGVAEKWNINMSQPAIIQAVRGGMQNLGFTAEQTANISNFNTMFFGMDMLNKPGFQLDPIIIFPILAAITMIASNIIMQKVSGQQAQMQTSMKIMMWGMNAWFVYWCFTMPAAFSLYYIVSNVCTLVQSLVTNKFYSPEKFKAQYEAEIAAKKAAKKQKKQVTVVENGTEVEKEVGLADLNRLRMEAARRLDADKYADERTQPLDPNYGKEEPKPDAVTEAADAVQARAESAAAAAEQEAADHVENLKNREDEGNA